MAIPRWLHAWWDSTGPSLPAHLAAHLDEWQRLHPAWRLTLWTNESLPRLRYQALFDEPRHWSPRSNPHQFRANLVRYELLLDLGGVWIDCDLEPRQPIDGLLAGVECFAAWETQGVWINNAFMGCEPSHEAMEAIVDGIDASVRRHRAQRSNKQTGAQYITPILRDRDDVTLFDRGLVYPYRWDELERATEPHADAVVVHHWHNRRRRRGPR